VILLVRIEAAGGEVVAKEIRGRELSTGVVAFENDAVVRQGSRPQEALAEDAHDDQIEAAADGDNGKEGLGRKEGEDGDEDLGNALVRMNKRTGREWNTSLGNESIVASGDIVVSDGVKVVNNRERKMEWSLRSILEKR
jgi:hypothetical protein